MAIDKVTTASIEDANITTAKLAYEAAPFRNIIINGDMSLAQRGTSFTSLAGVSQYNLDRWETIGVNVGSGRYQIDQSTDTPTGFTYSQKISCTTAEASQDVNNQLYLEQQIEGLNSSYLNYYVASPDTVTLSFWVKSNMTGTYQFNARDQDNVKYISASYTVNFAGTWEYKTITLAGDTTGVLDNDANESLKLEWWLDSGSNFNSGTLNTSWTAASNANRNVGATVNIGDSTSNYWQITGVCLNVGDSAIDFPHESYGETLAKCQRYYYQVEPTGYNFGAYATSALSTQDIWFPVTMRASPSLSNDQSSSSYTSAEFVNFSLANNHAGRLLHRSTSISDNARYNGGMILKADAEL